MPLGESCRETVFLAAFCLYLLPGTVRADPAVIEAVTARLSSDTWTFVVTIRHDDTGWDDYADGWRILDLEGTEPGMCVLLIPM